MGPALTVCIPIIAPRDLGGKPPTYQDDDLANASAHLPGFPHAVSRAETRRQARLTERQERDRIRVKACDAFEARLNSIELGSTCRGVSLASERRGRLRVAGLVLGDHQRDAARTLLAAAAQCGSSFVALRGFADGPGPGSETRMVCRRHCGTRQCEDCAGRIRARQAFRVQGPWNTFLTFTVPRAPWTLSEAWAMVHDWIRVLLREMRRERALACRRRAPKDRVQREQWEARRGQARERVHTPPKLAYAWAIEAQEDGWPHVHMVINWSWVGYAWIRYTWASSMGALDAMVDGRRVFQRDGVCAYLCKYISKARLSLDLLAILKGRRLWASTVDAPIREQSKWMVEDGIPFETLNAQVRYRHGWGESEGWTLKHGKDEQYAVWSRTLADVPIRVVWIDGDALDELEARDELEPARPEEWKRPSEFGSKRHIRDQLEWSRWVDPLALVDEWRAR